MVIPKTIKKIGKAAIKNSAIPIKAVKKIIPGIEEKVVEKIEIFDFKKLLSFSTRNVVRHQEEINKINVFPVADRDTGYNLAATLLGIEGAIAKKEYKNRIKFIKDIQESAMINARGNAGMITVGYLIEFLNSIKGYQIITTFSLAKAMKRGARQAWRSIEEPVKGTILDVMDASADKAWEMRKTEKNIIRVLEECIKVSQKALNETTEKLEVLKKHNVVDAGGLGFLKVLEGWLMYLKEISPREEVAPAAPLPEVKEEAPLEYRYCLTAFSKKRIKAEEIKNKISDLGGSIEFLETAFGTKFHIHTNFPEKIKERIKELGQFYFEVEDMAEQTKVPKKPIGLVVGETAGLPKEFLEKYQIEEVPFPIDFPEAEKLPGKTFFEKLKKAKALPLTPSAPFGNYLVCYKKALNKFKKILVITLSCKLSGSFAQARIARAILRPVKKNIVVFDPFLAGVGEGLVAIRAQELIGEGKTLEEILEKLIEFSPKVKLYGMIEDFRYGIKKRRYLPLFLIPLLNFLAKLGIRPLFTLKEGKVRLSSIKFGARNIPKTLAKEIKRQSKGQRVRVAISHAENEKAALVLKGELEKMLDAEILYLSSISPTIGGHTGPGTLIVAFCPA